MKEIFVNHGDGSTQSMMVPDNWEGDPQQFAVPAEAYAQIYADRDRHLAEQYLKETDWYVTRKFDTGVPLPADVEAKRQQARDTISAFRANYPVQDTPETPVAIPPATQFRMDASALVFEDRTPEVVPPEEFVPVQTNEG